MKTKRVVLFAYDLLHFCSGERSVYKLYHDIREAFNLPRERRITIFHVRDYFNISLEDVCIAIFGE